MSTVISVPRGFRNVSNYRGPVGEVFTMPSKAVPEQSISVRELFDRHKAGGLVKSYTPVFADDSVPAGLERMSRIDRAAYAAELSDFVAEGRRNLITQRESRAKAAAEAVFEAAVAARVAASAPTDSDSRSKPKAGGAITS